MNVLVGMAIGVVGVIGFLVSVFVFDSFDLGIIFPVLTTPAAIWATLKTEEKKKAAMRKLAEDMQMEFFDGDDAKSDQNRPRKSKYDESFATFGWVICGVRNGLPVRIYFFIHGPTGSHTGIQIQYNYPHPFSIKNRRLPSNKIADTQDPADRIHTGDAHFDKEVAADGGPDLASLLADASVRASVQSAVHIGSEFLPDGLYFEERGLITDKGRYGKILEVLTAAADHFVKGPVRISAGAAR